MELAKSMNCAACHLGQAEPSSTTVPNLDKLSQKLKAGGDDPKALEKLLATGCLSDNKPAADKAPRMNLKEEQKKEIAQFLLSDPDFSTLKNDPPSEFAERQFATLRCHACHDRDDARPRFSPPCTSSRSRWRARVVADDAEPKLDQSRPHLSFTGEALTASYVETMLLGRADPRPRPWLDMRMPGFGQHAKLMAEGMAQQHGVPAEGPDAGKRSTVKAEIGSS